MATQHLICLLKSVMALTGGKVLADLLRAWQVMSCQVKLGYLEGCKTGLLLLYAKMYSFHVDLETNSPLTALVWSGPGLI